MISHFSILNNPISLLDVDIRNQYESALKQSIEQNYEDLSQIWNHF
jgi:hypothetical protein